MRIPFPDLSIAAMDQKLRAFSLGRLPRGVDGGRLGAVMRRVTLSAFPSDRPFAVPWNNVYIFRHKTSLPAGIISIPAVEACPLTLEGCCKKASHSLSLRLLVFCKPQWPTGTLPHRGSRSQP